MKNNILELQKYIRTIDANVQHAVHFMDCDDKMNNLFQVIRDSVIRYDLPSFYYANDNTNSALRLDGVTKVENRVKEVYLFLDKHWWNYTWRLHDVHFHRNFGEYVSCVFTTANEIDECLEKILKEQFCA